MDLDLFDFTLPEENIALRPCLNRGETKLLHVLPNGQIRDQKVKDLPFLLKSSDVLVFNNTKVIPARLVGERQRGVNKVQINVTLHKQDGEDIWRAFIRPLKRLKLGERIFFTSPTLSREEEMEDVSSSLFYADLIDKYDDGEVALRFNVGGVLLKEKILSYGTMPLPPYIASKRPEDIQDEKDYQTIFAKYEGAVAAPTAGLHFTQELLDQLKEKNIAYCFVTLHVGAGTFFPVKVQNITDHKMHSEYAYLDEETALFLNQAKSEGRRIIAVGTTSLRVLESAAIAPKKVAPYAQATDIFITPNYEFSFIDGLITNFHLPRSTLFMLVCALCGMETMQKAYQHAIENGYRFYSYGDTSLLERARLI